MFPSETTTRLYRLVYINFSIASRERRSRAYQRRRTFSRMHLAIHSDARARRAACPAQSLPTRREIRSGTGGGKFLAPTRLRVWPWTSRGIRIGNARSFHPIGDWNRQQGRENGSRRLETGSSRCQKNNRESPWIREIVEEPVTALSSCFRSATQPPRDEKKKGKKKREEEERGEKRHLCFVPRRWRMQSAFLPVVYVSRTWPNAFSNYIFPSPSSPLQVLYIIDNRTLIGLSIMGPIDTIDRVLSFRHGGL